MIRLGLRPLLNQQRYIARRKPRSISEDAILITSHDQCYIQYADRNYIRVLPDVIRFEELTFEERVLIEQSGCYIQLANGDYIRVRPDEIVSSFPDEGVVENGILTEDGFELATEDGFTLTF